MSPRLARTLVHLALGALTLVTLLPLLWMLSVSFMPRGEASAFPPPLLPHHATVANYRLLFSSDGAGRYLANSLWLAVIT